MTPEAARSLADAGPWAVVIVIGSVVAVAFVRAIVVLWREHLKADQDDRTQRDEAFELVKDLVPAVNRLAAATEERNRRDAKQHRRTDPT